MNIHLAFWLKLLGVISTLLCVGIFLVVVIMLSPIAVGSPSSSAVAEASVTPDLSPETLCGKAFPFLSDQRIPPEKRAFWEAEYQKCVQARRAAAAAPAQTPDFSKRPKPQGTMGLGPTAVLPRKPAGTGTIIDSDVSPLSSDYSIENSWYAETQGKLIQVFAGARREEGLPKPRNTWQGVLVIWVTTLSGAVLPEGSTHNTPARVGSVKITDAQGQRLVLKVEDGSTFYFDVPARRFVSSLTEVVPTATPLGAPTGRAYPGP
ncbi:MAG: hypothetical protein AB1817_10810 [Chloroflexota bacterium]